MIEFNEDYKIGIKAIDNHHQELINLYNKLEETINYNKGGLINLTSTVGKLFNFCIDHFRVEDLLMETINYPNKDEHKKHHKDFLNMLDELSIRMEINDATIDELLKFIENLLSLHILKDDKELGRFYHNTVRK